MPDWLAILKAYVDTLETIVGTEGGLALANKLTAARAALLDQITALRLAELDAANLPADIDVIKADTPYLADASLPASPAAGSLARFIASGGTALGTPLPASKSLYDVIALDRWDVRLSAARAAYLDNINQVGLLQLTAARAGYLDNINNAQLLGITLVRLQAIDKLLNTACDGTELANTIARLIYELGINRLTSGRAGYLDNINNAQLLVVPNLSTLTAARIGYLDFLNTDAKYLISTALSGAELANTIGRLIYELGVNRLTSVRAGYLDNLSAGAVAQAASWTAALATALGNYTAARAAYLDNINQAGLLQVTAARAGYLDNLIGNISTGTFSLVNDTNEQDALVIAAARQLVDIELDMVNLAQNNTVREYVQVDGVNYRQISAKVFPTDFDTGTKAVLLSFPQKNALYKVTLQAAVAEGAAKNVPYRYITRKLS